MALPDLPGLAPAQFPRALSFLFQEKMEDGVTPVRYRVAYGGRGGTKSWGFARALLMQGAAWPHRVLCAREYQKSIKESVHKLIADQISALGMNYLFEVEQASIKGKTIFPPIEGEKEPRATRTEFFFEGMHSNSDQIKSYEGVTRAWLEEADKTTKASFEVLDPTLRREGSEIWGSFNPGLETDFFYQHFVKDPPRDALVRKVTWRDNPWFPDVLRRRMEAMKEKDPDGYLHVWEGHCRQVLEGAVYAEELRAARASGRICTVPYDPSFPVDVIFDLGHADETAMWFRQQVGFEYRLIDYYHNAQKPLSHYFEVMQGRRSREGHRYFYGMVLLPHDARAKQLGTGKSIEEQAKAEWGPRNVRIVARLSIEDGINAARQGFPLTYFDAERCSDGIQALSHYRYEVVEENVRGVVRLSRKPVHDWSSHGADAFRYEAVSRKLPRPGKGAARAMLEERHEEALALGVSSHGGRGRRGVSGGCGWMRR